MRDELNIQPEAFEFEQEEIFEAEFEQAASGAAFEASEEVEQFGEFELTGTARTSAAKTFRYVGDFSGPSAECVTALRRAGKTRAQAVTIINAQIGVAIAMLRKAATDLKRGSRSSTTRNLFLKIFRVRPEFVPAWMKSTATIKDRGDVVATRCRRVADLLASGRIKFFCTINSVNCPDCGNDPSDFACSSWGDESVALGRSNVICLGNPFWDDMKAGRTSSSLATLMHEPFHIYFGKYGTAHIASRGKFGGIYCILRFVFEANSRVPPDRVNQRCTGMTVRREMETEAQFGSPPVVRPETFEFSEGGTFESESPVGEFAGEFGQLDGPRGAFELQGEAAWEQDTDRVKWLQSSLNRIFGFRLAVDGVIGPATRSATRAFQQRRGLQADGIAGPLTEAALVSSGASPPPRPSPAPTPRPPTIPTAGRRYTNNPNEAVTTTTTPTARDVVGMLRANWSELTENGARTLTAQFMAETGGGRYCFNWNLGNVKSGPNEPHMYLRNVWECDSQTGADAQVARGGGLARIATLDEIRQRGWKCPNVVVVFDPPHPQCRFRAYASLQDGAKRWLGHHQRIARGDPNYVRVLNAGDVSAVAGALKRARYYTAAESDYARAMARTKADVDRALGPLPVVQPEVFEFGPPQHEVGLSGTQIGAPGAGYRGGW